MEITKLVGIRIQQARQRQDLSQAALGTALADYLGASWTRQTVSVAEKGGRAFSVAELVALAAALNTSLVDLVTPDRTTGEVALPAATLQRSQYIPLVAGSSDRESSLDAENAALHRVLIEQTQRLQAVTEEYQRGLRAFADAANPASPAAFQAKRNLLTATEQQGGEA